jgi:hypothetical protein
MLLFINYLANKITFFFIKVLLLKCLHSTWYNIFVISEFFCRVNEILWLYYDSCQIWKDLV